MGATLFTLLGFKISWKTISYGVLAIIVGALLWLAYSKVNDHFEHVRDVEQSNIKLDKENQELKTDLDEAVRINEENVEMWKAEREAFMEAVRRGAEEDAKAEERRTVSKEIQHEIDRTAPTDDSVAPVIVNTLDRLWR